MIAFRCMRIGAFALLLSSGTVAAQQGWPPPAEMRAAAQALTPQSGVMALVPSFDGAPMSTARARALARAEGHELVGYATCRSVEATVANCIDLATQKDGLRYQHRVFGGDCVAMVQRPRAGASEGAGRIAAERETCFAGHASTFRVTDELMHFSDAGGLEVVVSSRFETPGILNLRWSDRLSLVSTFSLPDAEMPAGSMAHVGHHILAPDGTEIHRSTERVAVAPLAVADRRTVLRPRSGGDTSVNRKEICTARADTIRNTMLLAAAGGALGCTAATGSINEVGIQVGGDILIGNGSISAGANPQLVCEKLTATAEASAQLAASVAYANCLQGGGGTGPDSPGPGSPPGGGGGGGPGISPRPPAGAERMCLSFTGQPRVISSTTESTGADGINWTQTCTGSMQTICGPDPETEECGCMGEWAIPPSCNIVETEGGTIGTPVELRAR